MQAALVHGAEPCLRVAAGDVGWRRPVRMEEQAGIREGMGLSHDGQLLFALSLPSWHLCPVGSAGKAFEGVASGAP